MPYDHYMCGNGTNVSLDWSFLSSRPGFAEWAKKLPTDGSTHVYTAPKSDIDLYASLRSFSVSRDIVGCYAISDHYDFVPTDFLRANADESFSGDKAIIDLLTMPEWAYQLSGAREFTIRSYGSLP